MLKSVLFVLVVALFQLALSASVSITNPKPNQKIELGATLEIKWKPTENVEYPFEYVSIALASGPAQALIITHVIASKVSAKQGSYKWKVPVDIEPMDNYVIEIGPSADDIAFAGFVSIIKPKKQSGKVASNDIRSIAPVPTASAPKHGKYKQSQPSEGAVISSSAPAHQVKPGAKSRPLTSPSPTPLPAKPVALLCLAYPPESEGSASSTTCRPFSSYAQYDFGPHVLRPKKHGSHKRKAAASSKRCQSTTEDIRKAKPTFVN